MAGYGQTPKGADKRTKRVDSYYNPSELELLDNAQAVEMPGKPRGAYVRYAALKHAATVDTSILELRAEVWYYYHRDRYGQEVCYRLNGEQVRQPDAQGKVTNYNAADYKIKPAYYDGKHITPYKADRAGMHALAALLRAEAAEEGDND